MISNALENRPLPVYGDGMQIRDWLYVEDHCRAILAVIGKGRPGEIYNIGGNRSLTNLEVVDKILAATGRPAELIAHVTDRPGHDRRYALSGAKLEREAGWQPEVGFEEGLARTIHWYRENGGWVSRVRSGEYRNWYAANYGSRQTVG
jgi:dTDP-glucose 4,6-dehydratase